ncbi:hypothetical protein [Rhodococcus opacus]|uniref:hypothetical protein n=1 Tax=Rhodococcus opacus TaxID=37919 RepID=UPI0012DB012D|nr:hypothetical protein [Rhodococcus opacus]
MQRDRIALRDYVRARWWHRRLPRYPGAGFTVNAGIAINDGNCCNARITCVAGVAGVTSVAGIANVTGNAVIASITVIPGVSSHQQCLQCFYAVQMWYARIAFNTIIDGYALQTAMPVLLATLAN